MPKRFFISTATVALSITLSLTLITARKSAGQPSGGSQNPANKSNQTDESTPVSRKQHEGDIRALTDQLEAIRKQGTQDEQARAKQEQSWYFGERAPLWSNWILAVVAAIAGGVAYVAFSHQRKAVRLTQRADVLLYGVGVSVQTPAGPRVQHSPLVPMSLISLTFKNFGPTRANNLRTEMNLTIEGIQTNEPPDHPGLPVNVLGAGEVTSPTFPALGALYAVDTIKRVNLTELPLIFTVTITYDDVFGNAHTTLCSGRYYGHQGFLVENNVQAD